MQAVGRGGGLGGGCGWQGVRSLFTCGTRLRGAAPRAAPSGALRCWGEPRATAALGSPRPADRKCGASGALHPGKAKMVALGADRARPCTG